MTKRFWLHVSVSAALAVAACLFVWVRRAALPVTTRASDTPASGGVVLIVGLLFLFFFARLLLRSTGSDRAMGLLGLYAVVLYPPSVLFLSSSLGQAAALLLLTAALVEAFDVDLAPSGALRSGLFASAACVIEPAAVALAAALIPVVIAVAWPRRRIILVFALAVSIPWVVSTRLLGFGGQQAGLIVLRENASPGEVGWWTSALADYVRGLLPSFEGGLLSPYAALALTGLVVATVKRMGPSRRCTAAAVWILAVAALSSMVIDDRAVSLLVAFQYLSIVVLANVGLAALAAMNPLHAGRRRMIPVTGLFLLPPIVAWVRVFV